MLTLLLLILYTFVENKTVRYYFCKKSSVITVFFSVGLCNFENGLCGMKHDSNSEFTWLLWKNRRTTVKNALNFDHTTLSEKGNDYSSLKYNKRIM